MTRALTAISLLLALPPALDGALPAPASTQPALWSMCYAWYETATGPHARWSHWSDDKRTTPNPRPKSKAQPLIGYYDSDNPTVVRWHIQLAKASGIDAFLVSWWGGANLSGAAFEKTILPSSSWSDPYRYLKIVATWKGVAFTPPPLPGVTK